MKLLNKLNSIVEKFNGAASFISDYFKLKFQDAETVLVVNLDRKTVTRAIICINKDKARFFEIDLKANIGFSAGFGNQISIKKYMNTDMTSDSFVKNIQDLYLSDVRNTVDVDQRAMLLKRIGTAKISNDTGWTTKEEVVSALVKNGVHIGAIRKQPQFSDINVDIGGEKFEGFTLIGFTDKHTALHDALKNAAKILKKFGYENLLYGEFYSVPKRSTKNSIVLADYTQSTDDIRVFDISSKGEVDDATKTIIHELFHRHYYKFLTKEQRLKVFQKYQESINTHKKEVKDKAIFNIGDKFFIKGKKVEYQGLKPITPRGQKVAFVFYVLGADDKQTGTFFHFKTLVDAALVLEKNKQNDIKDIATDFVPTAYSRTTEKEWYSDVVSYGLFNETKSVIEWLKTL